LLIAFNKPFGVICRFRQEPGRPSLADHIAVPRVYPAGRLDADSEGLLLLTDDGALQARIASPRHELEKVYWAQVEGRPTGEALAALRDGIDLGDFRTRPAGARLIDEPGRLWSRDPPIRYRARIPTSWLELTLREGKNRQVRRMTARVGHPTLRLIRASIGKVDLERLGLGPGEWRSIDPSSPWTGR
jgi:23S rRNA pseudouridine2457 synthase